MTTNKNNKFGAHLILVTAVVLIGSGLSRSEERLSTPAKPATQQTMMPPESTEQKFSTVNEEVEKPRHRSHGRYMAEDFKGPAADNDYTVGGLMGANEYNGKYGLGIVGNFARRVIQHGFVPDINDQVFVELELGPSFFADGSALFYSAHLRWDFEKDYDWTFFALGGIGGYKTFEKKGNEFRIFPRFGAGVLFRLTPEVKLRAEVSHEYISLGALFCF